MEYLTLRAQIASEQIHKAKHLFGKLLRIEIFAVVPEIKAVYEHVLHFWFIIFNRGGGGGGEGYVAQRHVFSEGVYSQSSHNVTEGWEGVEKWQKKRHVFSERPLAPFRRSSSYLFDASSYLFDAPSRF